MRITYKSIGVIHTPFKNLKNMPIQPAGAMGLRGTVEVFSDYREGLKDLKEFSHIILLYHFHKAPGFNLRVIPFMDSHQRGLFATRAPKQLNSIGLSVVRLLRIERGILHIENVDILDGTPLLDIKPYVSEFDKPQTFVKIGWLQRSRRKVQKKRSDDRFV